MNSFFEKIKSEHILIVGFASKTGLAAGHYLAHHQIRFSISELKADERVEKLVEKLAKKPVRQFFGPQGVEQLENIDRIIIAPGVPRNISLIKEALKRGIPVDSEIAFALNLLKDKELKVIGITGTDGKSTTSALTHHILSRVYTTYLLGNFGEPLIARVDEIKNGEAVVLELSSYQLEDGEKYRLNGATIINVAPDHLNRYVNMDEYRQAKEKIFINQEPADVAVLYAQNPFFESWKKATRARVFRYDFAPGADFSYHDNAVWYQKQILISDEDIFLKGEHNRENIMIASAFAHYFGVPLKTIRQAVADFRGLEHRTEYLGVRRGVHFINDSKATTVQAVIKSLSTAEDSIILILGGSDKKLDFTELRPYLEGRVKKVICYGETKDTIAAALNFPVLETVFEFDRAFFLAVNGAKVGDTVLLSPGCASFDQFNSYEERGQRFKNLVEEYEKETV